MLLNSLLKAKDADVRLHTTAGVFEGTLTELDSGRDLVVLEAGDIIHVALSAVVAVEFPQATRSVGF